MKTRLILAILFSSVVAAPSHAADPALPPDLAAVPADAVGFVHVRLADVWKSDALKEFRETVLKAGAKALEGFDARFLPTPSSIDRLTVVMIPKDSELQNQPDFIGLIAFNKPFDKDALLKAALPKAVEQKTTNGSFFADEKTDLALFFIDNRVIVLGKTPAIKTFVDHRANPNTEMLDALRAANSKRHITVAANMSKIPAKAIGEAPAEVRPLLLAKLAVLSLDIAENAQIDLSLQYGDDKASAAANLVLQNLAKKGRDEIAKSREEMMKKVLGDGKVAPLDELPETALALVALGSFAQMDEMLANPPVKLDGNYLRASVKIPSGSGTIGLTAIGAGLLIPAVQKVRESAARISSVNNLKQIGIAMHIYHDANNMLPPAAICDKNGKPLLSWRVAILPYIEQQNLYNQFKLDEPWDSENNKKLIPLMPKTYMDPQLPATEKGITHYRIFYGPDAAIDMQKSLTLVGIQDGTSNTILAFEAADGVTWTKPEEFKYDPKKPLPKFASFGSSGLFNVLLADGSVRALPAKWPEASMRAAITANGGEVVQFP